MFRIATLAQGANPIYWDVLDALGVVEPEALFQPFAETVRTLAGGSFGRGFPLAVWTWRGISNEQRAILRTYIPGASADIYITTSINEDESDGDPEFVDFQGIASWMPAQEDKQSRATLGLEINFSNLVEIV